MLTIRRFQKGDEEILSVMIRRTLREVNYTSPKSELDYLIPHYSPETMVELSETGHTYVLEEDGQIIGSGTVLPDGETEAEIVAAFLSPESIGKGRFGEWLEHVQDWGISRNRYWGTPLNIWECSCGHRHSIGSIAELKELSDNCPDDIELHRPFIDDVTIKAIYP